MSKCKWVVEANTGDHVLLKAGKECGRIKEGEGIKADEGKPGSSTYTLQELKAQLENECGC